MCVETSFSSSLACLKITINTFKPYADEKINTQKNFTSSPRHEQIYDNVPLSIAVFDVQVNLFSPKSSLQREEIFQCVIFGENNQKKISRFTLSSLTSSFTHLTVFLSFFVSQIECVNSTHTVEIHHMPTYLLACFLIAIISVHFFFGMKREFKRHTERERRKMFECQ